MSIADGKGAQGIEVRRVVGLMEQVVEMASEVERLKSEGEELRRRLVEHLGSQAEHRMTREKYFGGLSEFYKGVEAYEMLLVVRRGRLPLSGRRYEARYMARQRVLRPVPGVVYYDVCSSYPASMIEAKFSARVMLGAK